jgi:hypothetical protein
MDDCLCCPDCGATEFKQTRVAQIEYTVQFDPLGGEHDVHEEVTDGGDRDGELSCDCGFVFCYSDDLVTAAEYNESEAA